MSRIILNCLAYIYDVSIVYDIKFFCQNLIQAWNCSDPTRNLSSGYQTYQNGPSLPSPHSEMANWAIVCQGGYKWVSGQIQYIINCSANGYWSPLPPPCEGTQQFTEIKWFSLN